MKPKYSIFKVFIYISISSHTLLLSKQLQEQGNNIEVIIGAGGSAFNDLGIGALSALGLEMYDGQGVKLQPILQELQRAESCKWRQGASDTISVSSNLPGSCILRTN